MDDSKINKSEISYHNSVGKVDVHIKTGRMIYEYPLFALGGGNYQIMVSLLYNSHYQKTDYEERPELVEKILKDGTEKTRQTARETMRKVKKAMRLDYFEGE